MFERMMASHLTIGIYSGGIHDQKILLLKMTVILNGARGFPAKLVDEIKSFSW